MRNEFSDLVVDNMRKSRSMETNKWKVDDVESFMRRNYIVQVSEDGSSQAEASGDKMRQYSSMSSIDDELPELVVFLQETNYEFIKDICIDKAVTSREKCFEENCDVDNGYVPCMLKYNVAESNSESAEEPEDLELSTSSTESTRTRILEKDIVNKVIEKQKVHSDAIDEVPYDVSNKKSVPKLNLDRQVTSTRTAASVNSIAISLTKILDENKHKGKAVAGSKIEHGSVSYNSSVSPSSGYCSSRKAGFQPCRDTESTSMANDYAPENRTGQYRSYFGFVYQIEDGSSRVDPAFNTVRRPSLSSYSGSGSLRSNGSTNSSHSFAFPILQTEWNGSPERMAKADPMQGRRQKPSRLCFPCFNF